ncbi:MAG: CMP deaminase [Magnetococcales bacterium]|nr:CMP deaminase [Magnetococcales bacterium]
MPKWNERFLQLAYFVSQWSKDPKAKVGSVLLNSRGWPIALGFNGFPKGIEDSLDKLEDGELKNKMVVHAEQNALICAGTKAENGEIYIIGKPVCPRCAVPINSFYIFPNPCFNEVASRSFHCPVEAVSPPRKSTRPH